MQQGIMALRFFSLLKHFFIYLWLHPVFFAARRLLSSCGTWPPGCEHLRSCTGRQILSHWTTREVPLERSFYLFVGQRLAGRDACESRPVPSLAPGAKSPSLGKSRPALGNSFAFWHISGPEVTCLVFLSKQVLGLGGSTTAEGHGLPTLSPLILPVALGSWWVAAAHPKGRTCVYKQAVPGAGRVDMSGLCAGRVQQRGASDRVIQAAGS